MAHNPIDPARVVWKPQPRQLDFLARPEEEALYGGAAGGGKSDALLAEALRQVHIPHYRALILRKTYPQLTDLIDRSRAMYGSACPDAVYASGEHCWKFASGAKIYFGSMQYAKDRINYQGKAYGYPQEPVSGQAMWADLEAGVSYDVKYTVSDEFNAIDYFDYISSTVYLLHFLKGGTGIAVGKAAEVGNLFDVGLNSDFRRDVTVGGDLKVKGGLQLGGTDVGQSLKLLGSPSSSRIAYQSCLTQVTENTAVKWGRVVVTRLSGAMTNNNQMTHAGYEYHVADLPRGYFSSQYLPMLTASQNGMPCTGYVTPQGAVYLIPNQDGLQDTEISTVGIV